MSSTPIADGHKVWATVASPGEKEEKEARCLPVESLRRERNICGESPRVLVALGVRIHGGFGGEEDSL